MRDHSAGLVLVLPEANLCSAAASRQHARPVAGAPALGPRVAEVVADVVAAEAERHAAAEPNGKRFHAPGREKESPTRSPIRRPPANPLCIFPASFSPPVSLPFAVLPCIPVTTGANLLRIRCHILLQIQIIEQLEIRIHIVILFQSLQIAYRRARARSRHWRFGSETLPRVTNSPTPTPMITVSAAARTGRRNQCIQPACGFAISSRKRACKRTSKYGDGSGTCHSSSSAMVERIAFNCSAQAPQLSRCLLSSTVGSLNPAATSGIRSRISSHFITASPSLSSPLSLHTQNHQSV